MIKVYQSKDSGLEVVERPSQGCWIEMTDPSIDEAREVAQAAGLSDDHALEFVTAALEPDSIPRAEKADQVLFILVRIPYFQGEAARIPYVTVPLGILLTRDQMITVCKYEHGLLRDLDRKRLSGWTTHMPHVLVLHLLWNIPTHYLTLLSDINQGVDKVEDRLQRSLQNREVLELLRYQKSLVHFTTALKTNGLVLERLQRAKLLELKADDEDQLDDVLTENHEAMEMAAISSDILSQTMDAFASIIANNLNVVMKFLASITVVLIIPQIIGTFYGMNVGLPIQLHPWAFVVILSVSVFLSAAVSFIFWKKNWL